MKILIIEDNADILANLYGYLEEVGYVLDSASNGIAGLERALERETDLIILDIMLPGINGIEVCRKLRKEYLLDTPILMLTARDSLQDKVIGLDSGADDYLIKPFSMAELDARIKALVRRSNKNVCEQVYTFGPLSLNPMTHEVLREGHTIELAPTGFKLLCILIRAAPKVVSRVELERNVWGESPPDSDALRTHIHGLRLALDKQFDGQMLKTIQNVGYKLVLPNA